MRCLYIFTFIIILLISLLFPIYNRLDYVMEFNKTLKIENHIECNYFSGFYGAEDSARIEKDIIIFSYDDRMTLWETKDGLKNTKNGGLFVLFNTTTNNEIKLQDLPLNNYPKDLYFHPHGIYVHTNKNNIKLLYVINHAYNNGGERIDVFKLQNNDNLSNNSPISVFYQYSIGKEYFSKNAMGILNDLIVLNEGEFFVTQYLPFQDLENGRYASGFWNELDHFKREILSLVYVILKIQHTYVNYCTYSTTSNDIMRNVECSVVASCSGCNGINSNLDKSVLFVSDPLEHDIISYELKTDKNPLKVLRHINLPVSVDNIELHPESDSLFLGTIWSVNQHKKRLGERSSKDYDKVETRNPGGSIQLKFDSKSYSYTFRELVLHDGNQLSSISVSTPFGDNMIALGSWEDKGILICPIRP